jgi:hypothetical protein
MSATETKKCAVIIDGRECGLELERDDDTGSESILASYRCALGHRTHALATQKRPNNPPGGKIRDRKKSN